MVAISSIFMNIDLIAIVMCIYVNAAPKFKNIANICTVHRQKREINMLTHMEMSPDLTEDTNIQ